jgi:hypothetical protein
MSRKGNIERKSSSPRTSEEWEEWRAHLIREGRLRPGKGPLTLEEWKKLPKLDVDPETAAWIIRDLVENR